MRLLQFSCAYRAVTLLLVSLVCLATCYDLVVIRRNDNTEQNQSLSKCINFLSIKLHWYPYYIRGTLISQVLSSRNPGRIRQNSRMEKASRSENDPHLLRIKYAPGGNETSVGKYLKYTIVVNLILFLSRMFSTSLNHSHRLTSFVPLQKNGSFHSRAYPTWKNLARQTTRLNFPSFML